MRRTRLPITVAVLALILCAALAGAAAAPAAPGTQASGTITLVSNTINATKQAGGNTTIQAVAIVDFDGTLVGPAREVYTSAAHANGRTNQHGKGSFTGTIAGRTGTFDYVFRGDATSGFISITGGTGGLSGAHGKLAYTLISASPSVVFDYSGYVFFT